MEKYFFLVFLLFVTSCAAHFNVKEETSLHKDLKLYNRIVVGWLDLDANKWEEFGYDSIDTWSSVIKDANISGLQVYLKDDLPEKEFVFVGSNSVAIPTEGDLYIKFTDTRVEKTDRFVAGGFDYIHTTVHFYDRKINKEIYKASFKASSMGFGPQGFAFEGRLGHATRNLVEFLSTKLH